jgi:hypothetical protein
MCLDKNPILNIRQLKGILLKFLIIKEKIFLFFILTEESPPPLPLITRSRATPLPPPTNAAIVD